jgi:two-component system, chemotaxis family, chemotaxis protein CheY
MNSSTPIMVVDDHQTMRRTIASILRSQGYTNLHFAENGKMAWKLLQEMKFSLVLLDWNMPQMTGIELLKKIKADTKFSDLPVLMVTAEAEKEQVIEAIFIGATDYIVKPFTPAVLDSKVKALLETDRHGGGHDR